MLLTSSRLFLRIIRLSENSVFDQSCTPFLARKGAFDSGGHPQTPFLGATPPQNPVFGQPAMLTTLYLDK